MSKPVLSIIVPVRNEAAGIEAFLHTLQPWRQAGHELILVDGSSEDASADLARPLVDQLLISKPGRARQMNAGAAKARGDLLLFQHVDTELPAAAVQRLQGLSAPVWGRFDVRLTPGHWMFPVIARMMNLRSRLTGIATGDQSLFVSAELFRQVGGFPDQPLMEDIELSRRLKRLQAPLCCREAVTTSSRRWQKNGVWRTILLMWGLRLRYFFGTPAQTLAAIYYPAPRCPETDKRLIPDEQNV